MTKPWSVILFAIAGIPPWGPLSVSSSVNQDTISLAIGYERASTNEDITVSLTALDHTPEEWAGPTVSHVWFVWDPRRVIGVGSFVDDWPHMRPGHYKVQVVLHRTDGKFTVPDRVVEVN